MKRKQVFATVTALCLTAALGIGATLAVLTRTSSQVTNTFSVGSGIKADAILLDEAKVVDKTVVTPMGRLQARLGDYVIREKDGTIYPCGAKTFGTRYERVRT